MNSEQGGEIAKVAGFDAGATDIEITNAGEISAMAREQAQIQAALVIAKRFPRNEATAYAKMQEACVALALVSDKDVVYSYPRGGKTVQGPSVYLAREMAQIWGNVRYGFRIVSMDAEYVHVCGFAYDCQTNTAVDSEAKFKRLIQRKRKDEGGKSITRWVEPDERDLRELTNKHGAICCRNSILQLMPGAIVVETVEKTKVAMAQKAVGDIKSDRGSTTRKLAVAFFDLGVSADVLAEYLGHGLDAMSAEELVELRGIYGAIKDGIVSRSDVFQIGANEPMTKADIREKLTKKDDGSPGAPGASQPTPQGAEARTDGENDAGEQLEL